MNWGKFYIDVIEVNLMFFMALIFIPLELLFPYNKKFKFYRNGFWQDIGWIISNEITLSYGYAFVRKLFFVSLIPLISIYISSKDNEVFGFKRIVLTNDFLIAVMLFWTQDFFRWFSHFTSHKFKILWRNHILHHSSEQIDCVAGFRGYWLDNLYMDSMPYLPLLFFDIPIYWLYIIGFVEVILPFFLHANINFPRWKIFKFFVHPHYHRWHHAKIMKFSYGQNFGFFSTTFDRLFGTYYNPEEDPESYGIKDAAYPKGFVERFLYPVTWKKYSKK